MLQIDCTIRTSYVRLIVLKFASHFNLIIQLKNTMIYKVLKTDTDMAGLIARITIGLILFPHGSQKLLGYWGGHGFTETMAYFTDTVGLPYAVGATVIFTPARTSRVCTACVAAIDGTLPTGPNEPHGDGEPEIDRVASLIALLAKVADDRSKRGGP